MLGKKAKDKITGFTGVITGFVEYISGCNQYLLCPPVKDDGTAIDGCWFDVQRCEILEAPAIKLDNGATPGCDAAAPVR